MASAQWTMREAIKNNFSKAFTKLKSNESINGWKGMKNFEGALMKHSYGTGMGMMVGGAYGAYQGATDGYRDPVTGGLVGGLSGAIKGGAVGYFGSLGMATFKGPAKAAAPKTGMTSRQILDKFPMAGLD